MTAARRDFDRASGPPGRPIRFGSSSLGEDAVITPARRSWSAKRRWLAAAVMSFIAGYPAINLPNGFAATGTPTNATIYAQPYRELEILALAKAYQDAAKHHLVTPRLDA